MEKIGLEIEQLFLDPALAKKHYLQQNASEEIDFSSIDTTFQQLKDTLLTKLISTDPALEKYGNAEWVKLEKQVEGIKEKIVKTTKQRHETGLKTIDSTYHRLFPNGGLQERVLNFFTFCANGKVTENIELLNGVIDPFDPDFVVIRE